MSGAVFEMKSLRALMLILTAASLQTEQHGPGAPSVTLQYLLPSPVKNVESVQVALQNVLLFSQSI